VNPDMMAMMGGGEQQQGPPPMDPGMLEAIMAQLGGGAAMAGGAMPPPQQPEAEAGGDLMGTAINAVHQLMVQEGDPKAVSLLGAILNQLTTYQANKAAPAGAGAGG